MSKSIQLILSIFLFFMIVGCGGGSETANKNAENPTNADTSQKYNINKNKNVAILGALKDANITAYRFYEPDTIIEQTKTNDVGEFSLKLSKLKPKELVIIKAQGGYDIDINDNGYIDKTPTKNNSTISLVASVDDILNKKAKVSLLSDIVYRFSKHEIGKTDKEDFLKIMSYIASKLINTQKYSSNEDFLGIISNFNPTSNIDRNKLSFKYKDILNKEKTKLISYYHEGDDKAIDSELESLFNVLSINDARYANMKTKVKVELSTPIDTNIESSNSTIFYNLDKKNINLVAYLDKNTSFSLKAKAKTDNKIIGWRGCSSVSKDNETCFLNNIQEDKFIVAIIVPDKVEMNPNITFRDLTGSKIVENNNTYTVQNADISMQNTLESVNVGDVILSRGEPSFFKEVTSIQKVNNSHYVFNTKFIPLEEVVQRGYILSSSINSNPALQKKIIKRSVTFDSIDGNKYNLTPDENGFYHVDFSDTNNLSRSIKCNGLNCQGVIGLGKKKFYDGKIELSGSLAFKPIFDFNMGWSWGTLKSLSLEVGVNVKPKVELKVNLFGKKFKPEKIQLGSVSVTQIFVVGILPVALTEGVDFYMGVEGKVEAYYSTSASVNANLSVITSWVKGSGVDIKQKSEFGGFSIKPFEVGMQGDVMGFVEVSPFASVYIFGAAYSNKIGIYGEAKAAVGLETTYDHVDSEWQGKFAEAKFSAGARWKLAVEPRFPYLITEMPFVRELKEKLGSYEFADLKYPLYKKSHSVEAGYDKVDIKGKDLYITKYSDETLIDIKEYTLKNTGNKTMYYSARIISENLNDIVKLDKYTISGELKAKQSKQVKVNIYSNDLSKLSGDNIANVNFYLSKKSLDYNIFPKESYKIGIRVFKNIEKIKNFNAHFSADMYGDKLHIYFDKVDDVDGYIIYKALASERGVCSKNYSIFHVINNQNISSYEAYLDSINNQKDATKHIINSEQYCFNVASYKNQNDRGEQIISKLMDDDFFITYASHTLPNFTISNTPQKGYSGDIFTFSATTSESLASQYDVKIRLADGGGGFLEPIVMNADSSRKNFTYENSIYNEGRRVFEVAIFLNDTQMTSWKQKDYIVLGRGNIAPSAFDLNISTTKNKTLNIKLKAYDEDADKLSFTITSKPSHGNLEGTPPSLTYTPNTNFVGNDSFTFKVNDGKEDSNEAKVRIAIKDTAIKPTSTSKALKTGQTKSYADYDDGYYQKGLDRSYTRNGNIVTDNVTGLQWQDDNVDVWNTWEEAKKYCDGSNLDGKNNWRLPTIRELKSVVDRGKGAGGSFTIDLVFKNAKSTGGYWSSTKNVSIIGEAWGVVFTNGGQFREKITRIVPVHCVSGTEMHNATCTRNNSKHIVSCSGSGLIWQDNSDVSNTAKSWKEAINYCNTLDFAGYVDWRLPNYNELESIVDYARHSPAIVPAFQNTSSSIYWSATTYAPNTSNALIIDFNIGGDHWKPKSSFYNIRCVRGK